MLARMAHDPVHDTPAPQTLGLLAWISRRPRTYAETMDAWRSSCPRHTAWEDASIAGLVRVERSRVSLTELGRVTLAAGT